MSLTECTEWQSADYLDFATSPTIDLIYFAVHGSSN